MFFKKSLLVIVLALLSLSTFPISLSALKAASAMSDYREVDLKCINIDKIVQLHDVSPEGLLGNPQYALMSQDLDVLIEVKYVESTDESIVLIDKETTDQIECSRI